MCFVWPASADEPASLSTPPSHHKTISENTDANGNKDGSYHISLDVTGEASSSTESTPVDVVIVFDRSNSMGAPAIDNNGNPISGKTRLDVAKSAANQFVSDLIGSEDSENRVAFVEFGTTAKINSSSSSSSSSRYWFNHSTESELDGTNGIINSIETYGTYDAKEGGTNWEDAFTKAATVLKTSTDSNRNKYVVFISDGDPTFRNTGNTTLGTAQNDNCNGILDVYGDFHMVTPKEINGKAVSITEPNNNTGVEGYYCIDPDYKTRYYYTYKDAEGTRYYKTWGVNSSGEEGLYGPVYEEGNLKESYSSYQNKYYIWNMKDNWGDKDFHGVWGNGAYDMHGQDYQATIDYVNNLNSSSQNAFNAAFSSEGITTFCVSTAHGVQNMSALSNAINAVPSSNTDYPYYYHGETPDSLSSALSEIKNKIVKTNEYKNVTIQDKLSDYVTFNEDGTNTIDTDTFKVYKTVNGKKTEITDATVSYDSETGLITYQPENGGKLEAGATYSVEFDVWPNQAAYNREANIQNGTATGDTARGQGTNGKQGDADSSVGVENGNIFSNNNEKTLLKFDEVQTVNGKESPLYTNQTADYEDPVVVVPTSSITATKEWVGGTAESSATIKLQWKDGTGAWVDYTVNGTVQTVTLNSGNKWSATFSNLPAGPNGHDYRVVETSPDSSSVWKATYTYKVADTNGGTGSSFTNAYESSASADGVNLKGRASQSASAKTTNTKTTYSLQVVKKGKLAGGEDTDAKALEGAGFTLYKATVGENNAVTVGNQVGTATSDENGELTFSKLLTPGETYVLKETTTPNGYVTHNPIVLVVGSDGTVTSYETTVSGSTITKATSGSTLSTVSNDTSTYTMTVVNTMEEYDLPSAGGFGFPFAAAGLAVAVMAAGALFARRRLQS
jgi:hypothetical protein